MTELSYIIEQIEDKYDTYLSEDEVALVAETLSIFYEHVDMGKYPDDYPNVKPMQVYLTMLKYAGIPILLTGAMTSALIHIMFINPAVVTPLIVAVITPWVIYRLFDVDQKILAKIKKELESLNKSQRPKDKNHKNLYKNIMFFRDNILDTLSNPSKTARAAEIGEKLGLTGVIKRVKEVISNNG